MATGSVVCVAVTCYIPRSGNTWIRPGSNDKVSGSGTRRNSLPVWPLLMMHLYLCTVANNSALMCIKIGKSRDHACTWPCQWQCRMNNWIVHVKFKMPNFCVCCSSVCLSVCLMPVPFTERADTPLCQCAAVLACVCCKAGPLSSRPLIWWTHLSWELYFAWNGSIVLVILLNYW